MIAGGRARAQAPDARRGGGRPPACAAARRHLRALDCDLVGSRMSCCSRERRRRADPRTQRSRAAEREPSSEAAGCSATRAGPRRSWTSSSRCGTSTGRARRAARGQRAIVSRSRRTSTSKSARLAATRRPARSPSAGSSSVLDLLRRAAAETVAVHPVDDQLRRRPCPSAARRSARKRASGPAPARARSRSRTSSPVARSSACDTAGTFAEALDHARQRAEEARQFGEHVDPRDAGEDREDQRGRRGRTARAVSPPGARNTFSARPSRKPSRRPGASRKSSALRDGGVSSTITSKSCSRRARRASRSRSAPASPRPRSTARGRRGWRGSPRARSLVGREALDDLVERALGVEHHRPQLALRLDALRREQRRRRSGGGSPESSSSRARRRAAGRGRS